MDLAFTFPLTAGFHARPAAMLQDEAAKFVSAITFVNRTRNVRADVRSTLALISTFTARGDECLLHIEGDDATSAYAALRAFVERVLPHVDDAGEPVRMRTQDPALRPRALRGASPLMGTPVSPGIGQGPAYIAGGSGVGHDPIRGDAGPPEREVVRFMHAVEEVKGTLEAQLHNNASKAADAVLRVHFALASDPAFGDKVKACIREKHVSAEHAVIIVARKFAGMLGDAENPYLRERAFDVQDISEKILGLLSGPGTVAPVRSPAERSVVIAERLAASDFVALEKNKLAALVLERGETTSHTVILARAAGIPCVTGVRGARHFAAGQHVIVDAFRGLVFPEPEEEVRQFYKTESWLRAERSARLLRESAQPATSRDGARLEIGANCANVFEVQAAVAHGAEGIGVFRTEIAFAGNDTPPDEEAQLTVYREAVESSKGRPVIFRTFDVGGDKPVRWLPLPREDNPFLGYRAVRMYDEFSTVIDAQMRALLRAATSGPVQIMFPMIASPAEIQHLKAWLNRCHLDLARAGVVHNANVPVGMMIEIPSAVMLIDHFSEAVDFFSVGSNDLTQYLVAADRGNEKVRGLCTGIQPALLRSFHQVLDEAHKHGKWVGLCGELAGEESALPLLLGLGFDEISIGPLSVPRMKARLRALRRSDCIGVVRETMEARSADEIDAILQGFVARPGIVDLIENDLVVLSSRSRNKEEVLRELLGMLEDGGRVDDLDAVEEAVWQREDSFSTAMEYGMALPHCKSPHVVVPSIAVARVAETIRWSDEEHAVALVILIAIPERSAADAHLKIIAALARRLMHEEYRQTLLSASTREEVVDLVLNEAGTLARSLG